jgi:exosome complex component RRP4
MMFHVKDREVVTPGQALGADVKHDINCYKDGSTVYSLVRGLVRLDGESIAVIPSKGGYTPKTEDTVIGIVTDVNSAGWRVNIHSAYECFMRKDETEGGRRDERGGGRGGFRGGGGRPNRGRPEGRGRPDYRGRPESRGRFDRRDMPAEESFKIGDVISAKVLSVDEVYDANLTRPWKLSGGMVITASPKRIPRVIGRGQSMLTTIKDKTGCKIAVGQNGLIWLKGDNVVHAVDAIRKIEREAETQGLTDRIGLFLEERVKSNSRVD